MELGRVGDLARLEHVHQRPVRFLVGGERLGQRHVRVQRDVLLPGGHLDCRDDLAGDADVGEGPEGRLAVRVEVPDRLVQADHGLLDDVLLVRSHQEVRAGLGPGEVAVPGEEGIHGAAIPLPVQADELLVGLIVDHDEASRWALFHWPTPASEG